MSNIEWTEKQAMGLAKYADLLNARGRFNGTVRLDENALAEPLKRKKPTTNLAVTRGLAE